MAFGNNTDQYLIQRIESILHILRSDNDPTLEKTRGGLEALHKQLRAPKSKLEPAVEAEFYSLLVSHSKVKKAYLLGLTDEMRKSCTLAISNFTALAETRQLTDDELNRLTKTKENLRRLKETDDRTISME